MFLRPWDDNHLMITTLAVVALQSFYFVVTWASRVDKVADFAAGTNFFIVGVLTLCFSELYLLRQIVITCLACTWGLRLSSYLLFRTYHVTEDGRFSQYSGFQFLSFWSYQALWVLTVSLPVIFVNAPTTVHKPGAIWFGQPCDVIGAILACTGLILETTADLQKFVFRSDPTNHCLWCNTGLWRWSRHPNYLGEILFWWGMFFLAATTLTAAQWTAILSPLFTCVIIFCVSGIPLAERTADSRYKNVAGYTVYKRTTSVLLPMPPSLYRKLSLRTRCLCCLELPCYNFMQEEEEEEEEEDKDAEEPPTPV